MHSPGIHFGGKWRRPGMKPDVYMVIIKMLSEKMALFLDTLSFAGHDFMSSPFTMTAGCQTVNRTSSVNLSRDSSWLLLIMNAIVNFSQFSNHLASTWPGF